MKNTTGDILLIGHSNADSGSLHHVTQARRTNRRFPAAVQPAARSLIDIAGTRLRTLQARHKQLIDGGARQRLRVVQCFEGFASRPLHVRMEAVTVRVHRHDGGETLDAQMPHGLRNPKLL